VIGAGQAGRQVLSRLARLETGALFVASRSDRHAREAAALAGASVVALDRIAEQLPEVDVLFATLQTPAPVVDAASCRGRESRPLLAIDLSVPRAVNPAVAAMAGVTLRTVDDLGDIARESLARRVQEIPRVEALAHDEAARAWAQTRARAARAGERVG
jgi:glutamyl-tRNA reductase